MNTMNAGNKPVVAMKVSIYGREYPVACPAGEENALIHSAKFVDSEMRKVRESGKVVGSDRIAVMVSLNLAHELLILRHHHQQAAANAGNTESPEPDERAHRQRIDAMNNRIDNALEQYRAYQTD